MEKDSLPIIKQPQSWEEELPVIKQPQPLEEELPIIKQPQFGEEELPVIKQPQSAEEELPVIKQSQSMEETLSTVQQPWQEKELPPADEAWANPTDYGYEEVSFKPQGGVVNFCMECGMRLPRGATYCPYCGSELYRENATLMDCVKRLIKSGCRKLLKRQW